MTILRATTICHGLCALALAFLFLTPLSSPAADRADVNGFIGIVSKSDSQKRGTRIAFANLTMPKPFVTWPSGHGVETTKVFEDEELVVLLLVSITGSTETFYINKKTRQFTVIEAISATQLTETGDKALLKVTHGSLK